MKNNRSRQLSVYYGSLLTSHVKTILESGLLLDEDYEVLLKSFNFETFSDEPYKPSVGLIVCGVTATASIVFARWFNVRLLTVAPLAATAVGLYLEIRSVRRVKKQRDATSCLIDRFVKLHKLIGGVVNYLKTRNEVATKKRQENMFVYSKNIENFMEIFVERCTDLFYYILNELQFLSSLTESLYVDFEQLKDLNISTLLETDNLANESVPLTLKVKDLSSLLASKFLNYVGVTMCKNLNDISVKEVECLLNVNIPKLTARLKETFVVINEEFNRLRYSVDIKSNFQNRTPFKKHISGKLQQTLSGSVNNLSIVIEKSLIVLQKIDDLDDADDLRILQETIAELRDHAFATYESLDIICRLYGILSKSDSDGVNNSVKFKTNNDQSDHWPLVNFDDNFEPLEENYELYVDKDAISSDEDQTKYEDISGAYVGLMLKELKQCLKQHERFVAARNKRGIQDEEEINPVERKAKPVEKQPLKFDLTAVAPASDPVPSIKPVPPPPPPPFPNFNLADITENKLEFFKTIKSLSSQLKTREDVFGDEDSFSSGDDDDADL